MSFTLKEIQLIICLFQYYSAIIEYLHDVILVLRRNRLRLKDALYMNSNDERFTENYSREIFNKLNSISTYLFISVRP